MGAHGRGRRRPGVGAGAPRGGRDPADRRARGLRVRGRARGGAHGTSSSHSWPRRPTRSSATSRSSSTAASAPGRAWRRARSGARATTPTRWTAASSPGRERACRSIPPTDRGGPLMRASLLAAAFVLRRGGARVRRADARQDRRLHGTGPRRLAPTGPASLRRRAGRAGEDRRRRHVPRRHRPHAQRRRARPAVDRLPARLRHQRPLLRVPDRDPAGDVEVREYRRSAANPNVADPTRRAHAARRAAHRPATTTAASSSSGPTVRCTSASATTRTARTPRPRIPRSARSSGSYPPPGHGRSGRPACAIRGGSASTA